MSMMKMAHEIRKTEFVNLPYRQAMSLSLKKAWEEMNMINITEQNELEVIKALREYYRTNFKNGVSDESFLIWIENKINADQPQEQPEQAPQPIRVVINYGSYNDRRYSKPWMAKVVAWPVGKNAELKFSGLFVGTASEGGYVEMMAMPGELIRYGQKDNRNTRHTEANWAVVRPDGSIKDLTTTEAREYWNSLQ